MHGTCIKIKKNKFLIKKCVYNTTFSLIEIRVKFRRLPCFKMLFLSVKVRGKCKLILHVALQEM